MNVCAKQKETHIENKLMVTKGEREGECKLGVWDYEIRVCVCVCVCVLSHVPCNSMDYSLPSSSVHGILEWVAIARVPKWVSYSRDLPDPGIETVFLTSPELTGKFFTTSATWEAPCMHIFPLLFGFPSHLGRHRALSRVLCSIQ